MENPGAASLVENWRVLIMGKAQDEKIQFHSSVELFIEPDVESESCNYYFIDHENRSVFWLESCNTEYLGLPMTASEQNLSECSVFDMLKSSEG
jgi:hypothetical protein